MLCLNNITAGYDGKNIIKNIDLSFESNKIYSIIGKNGCGKSTLLKCCAGLLFPYQGEIFLEGKQLKDYLPAERARKISCLSQVCYAPNITTERLIMHGRHPHVGYPGKLRKADWDVIEKAMNIMQVEDLRNKSVAELSGGERQRVYLAMALAQDTEILLLDEPTTYMDIEYQLSLMERLGDLKAQGKTVVAVMHDLQQALRFSDEIVVMDNGALFKKGNAEEILRENVLTDIFHIRIKCIDEDSRTILLHPKIKAAEH